MIQRLWRTFRLFFMILLFLALGAYLVATTPWSKWFGPGPNYRTMVDQGAPIVAAIRQYRARTNLWPEYLEDLVPRDLPKRPAPEWYYTFTQGVPSLAHATGQAHVYLGCDLAAEPPRWRVFGDGNDKTLPSPPLQKIEQSSPEDRLANEIAVLHRRIEREPRAMAHRRDLVSLLVSLKREKDARKELQQALRDFPDAFWPVLANAALQHRPELYEHWVQAHPSFTHWYYLGLLKQENHDAAGVKQAIAAAMKLPAQVEPDDPDILAFYFFDMSRTALAMGDAPLLLTVTNAWVTAAQQHAAKEWSCLPLRAAAELMLGNPAAARADLQALDAKHATTWAQHVEALRKAVEAGDRHFRYDPGNTPPPYAIFQPPA